MFSTNVCLFIPRERMRMREMINMPMNPNYFVEIRRQNKMALLKLFEKNKGETAKKICAMFSLQTGLTMRIVENYMQELKEAELIDSD